MYLRIALLATMVLRFDSAQAHSLDLDSDAYAPSITAGLLLAVLWMAYCIGTKRLAPTTTRWLTFQGAGLFTLITIFDVLYGDGINSASLHMVQHLLMMVVIAPLFVFARPLPQWLAATGRSSLCFWRSFIRLSRWPLWISCLQGLLIWFWHAPKFYNLALENPWWHLAEHAGFMLVAGLFWWSVSRRRATTALLSVLFTLMHTGMLGALLTFARVPYYNDAQDLQDQQLAGLIMWVPGGLAYLIASGWCGLRLFFDDPMYTTSRFK